MVTAIEGAGTAEEVWLGWLALPPLHVGSLSAPLVVAPHPDDEILGVGGLLATLGAADVVAVTDGEGSHPESTVYTREELARVRRAETTAAIESLGLDAARVHRLGQPDGRIDQNTLTEALVPLLSPGRWCFATWRGDGHPDHEAVGRAAADACAQVGAVLVEYPIWMWHWATPDDPRVPWATARRVDLGEPGRARKNEALAAFRSQIEPLGPAAGDAAILPPHVLARFRRPFETVLVSETVLASETALAS